MGLLDPSELRPELGRALSRLHTGEYSDVVPIPSGFAVVTVLPAKKAESELNPERIQALVASGVVRYGIDVSGDTEENAVFQQYPKPEGWEHDLREVCSDPKGVPRNCGRAHECDDGAGSWGFVGACQPMDIMQGHGALSQLYAFVGDMDESIEQAKAAYQIAVRASRMPFLTWRDSRGALSA